MADNESETVGEIEPDTVGEDESERVGENEHTFLSLCPGRLWFLFEPLLLPGEVSEDHYGLLLNIAEELAPKTTEDWLEVRTKAKAIWNEQRADNMGLGMLRALALSALNKDLTSAIVRSGKVANPGALAREKQDWARGFTSQLPQILGFEPDACLLLGRSVLNEPSPIAELTAGAAAATDALRAMVEVSRSPTPNAMKAGRRHP